MKIKCTLNWRKLNGIPYNSLYFSSIKSIVKMQLKIHNNSIVANMGNVKVIRVLSDTDTNVLRLNL